MDLGASSRVYFETPKWTPLRNTGRKGQSLILTYRRGRAFAILGGFWSDILGQGFDYGLFKIHIYGYFIIIDRYVLDKRL